MIAVLCPVCQGKGVIYGMGETGAFPSMPCHGCAEWGSKGWLLVPELADGVLPMPYDDSYGEGKSVVHYG